jgi:hypothetical protein
MLVKRHGTGVGVALLFSTTHVPDHILAVDHPSFISHLINLKQPWDVVISSKMS